MAVHMVCTTRNRQGRIQDRLRRDEQLGRKSRRYQLRTHRSRPYHPLLNIENPRIDAQRARRRYLPPIGMERIRNGQGRCRLSRMRSLWPIV